MTSQELGLESLQISNTFSNLWTFWQSFDLSWFLVIMLLVYTSRLLTMGLDRYLHGKHHLQPRCLLIIWPNHFSRRVLLNWWLNRAIALIIHLTMINHPIRDDAGVVCLLKLHLLLLVTNSAHSSPRLELCCFIPGLYHDQSFEGISFHNSRVYCRVLFLHCLQSCRWRQRRRLVSSRSTLIDVLHLNLFDLLSKRRLGLLGMWLYFALDWRVWHVKRWAPYESQGRILR